MKNVVISVSSVLIAILMSICALAYEKTVIQDEFTFGGEVLSDYAGLTTPEISGKNAYVINLNTGVAVYQKSMNERAEPASAVKLLTALVAYENIPDLDTAEITVTNQIALHTVGTRVGLKKDEVLTARELLYTVMISGANDSALALAQYVSGDEASFCKLMNKKAKELGAVNSNFDNVTGMHSDNMYSTAKDIAIIAKAVFYNDELFKMSDTLNYTLEENEKHSRYDLHNRNSLIYKSGNTANYYKGAAGMSLGYTEQAGNCVVSSYTTEENLTYLCVVLGSPYVEDSPKNTACSDAAALFDFCRDSFEIKTVASVDDVICELEVTLASDTDHVTLFPSQDIKMLLPADLNFQNDIKIERRVYKESAKAPVYKGNEFGEIVVSYKDTVIGTSKLIAGNSVDKSNLLYFFNRVETFLCGTWFKVFAISAIALYVLYIALYYYAKYRHEKRRRR